MKSKIHAYLIDLGISLYNVLGIAFLFSLLFEVSLKPLYVIIASVLVSGVALLVAETPGKRLFIERETKDKLFSKVYHYVNLLTIILTIIIGWVLVEIEPVEFFTGFSGTRNILRGIFNPDTTIFYFMLTELVKTVYLALMATLLAVPIAFLLSFFAASNLMGNSKLGKTIYTVVRTLSTVIRSIEAIVWAIIFAVWVGIGPFAGMMALMTHSIAALIKLYSEQIENIDVGPIEAITSTGANTWQIWRYAVIPQIINPFLAFTIYRWDINVRMATIVGFVGGGGIGLQLFQKQQMTDWNGVGMIVWLIAFTVWIMDMISAKIRKKLLNN
ncbi:MAG: phosphonate ABC transporter, permease protein PhnE [Candidatus Cloacimonetes bacterium 4572_65]|nr:MAG: phosphonate ABC transporter, permease protein PhnE [Candidatus Cloacimonetes bacterium 4572_65]